MNATIIRPDKRKDTNMAEECTHNCESCSADCASRSKDGNTGKESLLIPANPASEVKHIIGVVSGKVALENHL